jgi:hypothetical protein
MSSTATFGSAAKRLMVSSRDVSAAVCMALLRSAMNLVGRGRSGGGRVGHVGRPGSS